MIVLDSDAIIDLLRKAEPTTGFLATLKEQGETLATTSVNAAEVLRGAHGNPNAVRLVLRALTGLAEVPFGPKAARRYGELMHALDRAGKPIGAMDGLVAAATLEAGGRLVTRNAGDFRRVPGLEVLVPR